MICPLMSKTVVRGYQNNQADYLEFREVECKKEKCALWSTQGETGFCSLRTIGL